MYKNKNVLFLRLSIGLLMTSNLALAQISKPKAAQVEISAKEISAKEVKLELSSLKTSNVIVSNLVFTYLVTCESECSLQIQSHSNGIISLHRVIKELDKNKYEITFSGTASAPSDLKAGMSHALATITSTKPLLSLKNAGLAENDNRKDSNSLAGIDHLLIKKELLLAKVDYEAESEAEDEEVKPEPPKKSRWRSFFNFFKRFKS